jgi:glycosyltransferase involved in cell wall biosynthesis
MKPEWNRLCPSTLRRVGILTSWNVRCGVAEYARAMVNACFSPDEVVVLSRRETQRVRTDEPFVTRFAPDYHSGLADACFRAGIGVLSVQYEPGMFDSHEGLVRELGKIAASPVKVILTLHGYTPILFPLFRPLFGHMRVLVHSAPARAAVAADGERNVTVVPLPCWNLSALSIDEARRNIGLSGDVFVLASAGFSGAYKRLEAVAELLPDIERAVGRRVVYYCLCANRGQKVSDDLRLLAGDRLRLDETYYEHGELVHRLSAADAIVLPHRVPKGSVQTSGIVRQCLASGRPVFTSDSVAMCDLDREVAKFREVEEFPRLLVDTLAAPGRVREMTDAARRYVRQNSWEAVRPFYRRLFGV